MSAMVVLAAMLRRCPYGPGRGLKKPRGRRAKAEVRRQARYIAHARAADCQSMTAREMLRAARHALLGLGRPSSDLRGIENDRASGTVTLLLRTMPASVAGQIAGLMGDRAPATVSIGWRFA